MIARVRAIGKFKNIFKRVDILTSIVYNEIKKTKSKGDLKMTRQEIIDMINKYDIQVIGTRKEAKIGVSKPTAELKKAIVENRQQVIDVYFDEIERKETERLARVETLEKERLTNLYSNQNKQVVITKRYDGKIIVENNALDILGIEALDFEGLKQYAHSYEDGNTTYILTVAELKALAVEKPEESIREKTEREIQIEKLSAKAKETGKPQILEEKNGWDPSKGIPVIDYKFVNSKGEVYNYTKELE